MSPALAQGGSRAESEQARDAHARAEAELAALPPGDGARQAALERRQEAARAW